MEDIVLKRYYDHNRIELFPGDYVKNIEDGEVYTIATYDVDLDYNLHPERYNIVYEDVVLNKLEKV